MLQPIDPNKLNGKQKEIYNFQKSASLLADYGFNCIKLSDDWQGADFLAHHFDGKTTLKTRHQFAHCSINYLDDGGIKMLFSNSRKRKVLTFDELSALGDRLRRVFTATK